MIDQGKLEEARAAYRQALAIQPDYAAAHFSLEFSKTNSEYNSDIKEMEDIYAKSGLSDEQRMYLAFALGKAFEEFKQNEKAFSFLLTGNEIKRQTIVYSLESDEKCFTKIRDLFTSNLFAAQQPEKCIDGSPIFVVGMPRSGTTLVKQILATHPEVHGAGELIELENIITSNFGSIGEIEFAENVRRADDGFFSMVGNEYIKNIRQHSSKAKFITDKMPGNFLFIGMIKLMIPQAKIINCRRDPLDTCLSIFKTLFKSKAHHYAYDLAELGNYYNLYRDLMGHWHKVLPNFIYDIQYEDVVADLEKQTRSLLAHCGLEWDPACLNFHQNDRPVMTASSTQVRRPLYKSSVKLWERYEEQLFPLRKIIC